MIPYKTVFTMMTDHKAVILAEGVRQAAVMAGGGKPSVDMIKGAAFDYAKSIAKSWILPGIAETLERGVKAWHEARGTRPTLDINDPMYVDWRNDFDDYLMACLTEDVCNGIGQDFCGEYFTDTELDNPDLRNRASQIAADHLVEAAVKARNAGQVLAEIGIVAEDLAAHAAPQTAAQVAAAPAAETVIDDVTSRVHVERVVGAYAIKVGAAALDVGKLTETLKLAFDDEMFLALTSIEAIGGTKADWPYFAAYMKASKTYLDDTVAAAFMAAMSGQLVEPAKAVGKVKKPRKNATAAVSSQAAAVAPPPASGSVEPGRAATSEADVTLIKLLRENRLAKDEDLAAMVGVSRPQISNVVNKGKPITLTAPQRALLKDATEKRIAGLSSALALLR